MKHQALLCLVAAGFLYGCTLDSLVQPDASISPEDTNRSDTDTDSSADSNGDTDADTNADTDADTNADADADTNADCELDADRQSGPTGSLTRVERGTWKANGVPNYVNMYIHVPGKPLSKPPIVVACHSCGTPVDGYKNAVQDIRTAADNYGFIIIFPEATGRNCWDVGSPQSLTHDGGGDTQAIAQMVQYTLSKYNGDPDRVYIMGGSSGAMMTQAMLAIYPDIFKAGSARAGVPAGCWADGYDSSNQWGGNCAGGRTTKSAQEWGGLARGMYPGYNGPRPRLQLFHGEADTTISYNNMGEAIKQWTNVLELDTNPTSTDTIRTKYSYNRKFWDNDCGYTVLEAWSSPGNGHSMDYEQAAILSFFGLDGVRCRDPEVEACGEK
jgi:poly(hydroxyalkanoate) depolymerase family esterase